MEAIALIAALVAIDIVSVSKSDREREEMIRMHKDHAREHMMLL
jgi:hypothetical protein